MGRIVNKSELAEIIGVSIPTVESMIRQGMPVKERGVGGAGGGFKIDVSDVMKWQVLQATRDVSDRLDAVNIDEARLRKVAAEAALAELDLALKRGDAVSLAGVAKRWEGMVTAFKYRCLAIPAKLAPILASETDLVLVRGMLEREIHEALEELADHGSEQRIRDGARSDRVPGSDGGSDSRFSEAAADVDGERMGRSIPRIKSRVIRGARNVED